MCLYYVIFVRPPAQGRCTETDALLLRDVLLGRFVLQHPESFRRKHTGEVDPRGIERGLWSACGDLQPDTKHEARTLVHAYGSNMECSRVFRKE